MSNEDILGMKNHGQHVTLPSIPIASNAFAPLALQHPFNVFSNGVCLIDNPPHYWLFLPKNKVIFFALQLHPSSPNIIPFCDQSALMLTSQKYENGIIILITL